MSKTFMDYVETKKYEDAKSEFNSVISGKIKERIQDMKKEVAANFFKGEVSDENS